MELFGYLFVAFLGAAIGVVVIAVPFRVRILELIDQRDAWRERCMECEGTHDRDKGPEVTLIPADENPIDVITGGEAPFGDMGDVRGQI